MRDVIRTAAIKPLVLAISLAGVNYAQAIGTGTIVSGTGDIAKSANTVNVNQHSEKMIIHWDNMDVGKNETLNFHQTPANAALNKINSINPTVIQGALNAGGKVFIVNPNGVLISKGAAINVGSLVASSLDIKDDEFKYEVVHFTGEGKGKGKGKVVNSGDVIAGDSVVLVSGTEVTNNGSILSKHGDISLSAGGNISLHFPYWGRMSVTLNQGSLKALVKNGGIIINKHGDVTLTAWATDRLARSVINNSGTIEANGLQQWGGGNITLMSGNGSGFIEVSGKLAAHQGRVVAKGNTIAIRDGASLVATDNTSLVSNKKNSYIRIGNVTVGSDHGNQPTLDITADNVLSTRQTNKASLRGQINISSLNGNTTLSEKAETNEKALRKGNGVVSATILDAVARQHASLSVRAFDGDVNYNHETKGIDSLDVYARGRMNLKKKIDVKSVSLSGAEGVIQAANAKINATNEVYIDLGKIVKNSVCGYCDWRVQAADPFIQKADIISGRGITINGDTTVTQNRGVKAQARDYISIAANTLDLMGSAIAGNVFFDIRGAIRQGEASVVNSAYLNIKGKDINLQGANLIKNITVNGNNMALANGSDMTFINGSRINGSLNVKSDADINVDGRIYTGGGLALDTKKNITFTGLLTAGKLLTISAENIIAKKSQWNYVDLEGSNIKLTARNDINFAPVGRVNTNGNLIVDAGHSAMLNGNFYVNGDARITAKEEISLYNTFITNGKRTLSAKKVNDHALSQSYDKYEWWGGWAN